MIYEDNSPEFMRVFRENVNRRMNMLTQQTIRNAKMEISGAGMMPMAVDTGRLMNSISFTNSDAGPDTGEIKPTPGNPKASAKDGVRKQPERRDRIVAVIGSNVEYAPFIELGTFKMRPRPFLRRALYRLKLDFPQWFRA